MQRCVISSPSDDFERTSLSFALQSWYIMVWITLSAISMLLDKYVMYFFQGFSFPITLALLQYASSTLLALSFHWLAGSCDKEDGVFNTYNRCTIPLTIALVLSKCLRNAAYMYLSAGLMQMTEAAAAAASYLLTSIVIDTEGYSRTACMCGFVILLGAAMAFYGQNQLEMKGLLLQAGSLSAESFYLMLLKQMSHQKAGRCLSQARFILLRTAPTAFLLLLPLFIMIEMRPLHQHAATPGFTSYPLILNVSTLQVLHLVTIFLLCGSVTWKGMRKAEQCKEWLAILLSLGCFGSKYTLLQICGFVATSFGMSRNDNKILNQEVLVFKLIEAVSVGKDDRSLRT
ncbi:hypothetical protein CEUSTIGMA_g4905.t1 [Chlamydomonas eustigma]|uniref:Sugar phosphate transporter domain-containing protein n=1 Tax=Chlamydomonas eustigma TaxID=1157962 RepID=A0A250X324_9CHLO|nr:hypothetical protein CEUSTIGMA_g4905.t1 [Chlamydomonas eustigma]|eukprot:GAX77461.1 hypothetical protein CEUSTIGMA_g4905.t1 [Chlamydomonas eustigma]